MSHSRSTKLAVLAMPESSSLFSGASVGLSGASSVGLEPGDPVFRRRLIIKGQRC